MSLFSAQPFVQAFDLKQPYQIVFSTSHCQSRYMHTTSFVKSTSDQLQQAQQHDGADTMKHKGIYHKTQRRAW